jgi:hypothetical protein
MKRIIGLVAFAALVGALGAASQVRTASASPATALHIRKECSGYEGRPGQFCTITASNVEAIPVHSKIFYFEGAQGDTLDSDLALYAGPGNVALGHVTLSFTTRTGVVTFRGGTGDLQDFQAEADVTFSSSDDENEAGWHWDGTYRYRGPGH